MSADTNSHHADIMPGLLLMVTTLIALVLANIPATRSNYQALVHYTSGITLFHHDIGLRFFVNEFLMCLFFFHIGLELKYSLYNGDLSDRKIFMMPLLGAFGGMLVPAVIYLSLNQFEGGYSRGWAIPTATDIAFAIGVLSLVKNRIPKSLKSFLLALAIFDDLGAILIIAFFYSHKLNLLGLLISFLVCAYLLLLNRRNHLRLGAYCVSGILLWFGLFVTGIHTTVGAVITAVSIPLSTTPSGRRTFDERNNVFQLAHHIAPYVNVIILPIFAFFNAGTSIVSNNSVFHPVGIGIILGLVVGKPLGILFFCRIGTLLRLCRLPEKTNWHHLIGMSFLCGIGFTMSLFIGKLAFYHRSQLAILNIVKKSVLAASLLSGIVGLTYLSRLHKKQQTAKARS